MPDVSGLVTTTFPNAKIGEVESKMSDTSSLQTTNILNTKTGEVESKLVQPRKQILMLKYQTLKKKCFATSDFNKFTK